MDTQADGSRKRKNSEEALSANTKKPHPSTTTGSDDYEDRPEAPSAVNHDSISDLSLNQNAATSVSSADAAGAVITATTMADLLATAGDSSSMIAHSTRSRQADHEQRPVQPDVAGISDEVLRIQQQLQLQQQIPLSPSSNTQLAREQIMRMILEESLKGNLTPSNNSDNTTSADQQHHQSSSVSQSSAVDASSVLMNLADPSILATLKPTLHSSDPAQSGDDSDRDGAKREGPPSSHAEGSPSGSGTTPPRNDPGAVTSDNPLHTKWLMATALKEKRIPYKTGTFSSHEDELIRQTIKDYVSRNNMPEDAIERWFENGNGRGRFEKNDLKALWVEIAVRLQTRPLLNIYLHVRRMFHPQNNVGAWSKEDDKKLVELYAKYKGQWTTIGNELGRMADSCRDRYRNHLKDQNTMITGPWQPHEDEKLLTIMQELALQQGKANILDSSPMWTLISERMEGTRTRHQCRHRYSQTLQPRLERGEWTAPSSAAAAAAAAVAADAAAAVESSAKQQPPLHIRDGLGIPTDSSREQEKSNDTQDMLILAAALQVVLPTNDNNMSWSPSISTDMQGGGHSNIQSSDTHASADLHHDDRHDNFSTASFPDLPIPSIVPKAPKGPIRRRSGLQQQLDVLRMIQEDGYTDHTDIKWADIAQRLRDRVEEANAAQLAKIVRSHDKLDFTKQQHLQHGNSAAIAAAAASAAMAAAVSAAQAEAVASLQRVPAANQIARTFMSSRCKIDGYKEMTLQQVIIPMMKDVEKRIQQRRRGSSKSTSANGSESANENGEGQSSPNTSRSQLGNKSPPTTSAYLQQQEINNAAQQAAIAALSAQFPYLQQHHQQQNTALAHALTSGSYTPSSASHPATTLSDSQQADREKVSEDHSHHHPGSTDTAVGSSEHSDQTAMSHSHVLHEPTMEEQAQRQQELEQQQHSRDLAEQMLQLVFSDTDLNSIFDSLEALSSSSYSATAVPTDLAQKQATRTMLDALKSSSMDLGQESSEDEAMSE
ncbi:hypothetical protein B0O80DRAFT_434508 [Mortierella sp. GBAus27b]|nr:hypothetical protein B0O80DRAFT_434508 [Mortierella sp. GBAus27b]